MEQNSCRTANLNSFKHQLKKYLFRITFSALFVVVFYFLLPILLYSYLSFIYLIAFCNFMLLVFKLSFISFFIFFLTSLFIVKHPDGVVKCYINKVSFIDFSSHFGTIAFCCGDYVWRQKWSLSQKVLIFKIKLWRFQDVLPIIWKQ